MVKRNKKTSLAALCGAMALCSAVAMVPGIGAFAAEAGNADIVVSGQGSEYGAYRLMDLTVSLKDADDGHDVHTKDCYNYAYTINDTYRAVLQAVAGVSADKDASGDVSDAEILDYLESIKSDPDAVRAFADALYVSLKDVTPDETTSGNVFNNVAQGYYLITERGLAEGTDSRSLAILDTAGEIELTVKGKESVPTLEKKVYEGDVAQDAADSALGSSVSFDLIGGMPENIANYKTYKYIFHDTIAAGLSIDLSSVVVKIGDTVLDGASVTGGVDTSDSCSLEVGFDDILAVANAKGITITADTKVVVNYTAIVTADAVSGTVGNDNTAHLEFSNDPYVNGSTSSTPDDLVRVFTYDVVIDKVDKDGKALAGANFKLQKKDADGSWVDYRDADGTVTDATTQFTFSNLDSGEYKLVETKVPNGYNKAADVTFTIRGTYDTNSEDPELTGLEVLQDGKVVSGTDMDSVFRISLDAGQASTSVVNTSGILLPETGGVGRYVVYGCGCMALVLATGTVIAVTRKKKKA